MARKKKDGFVSLITSNATGETFVDMFNGKRYVSKSKAQAQARKNMKRFKGVARSKVKKASFLDRLLN